MNRPFLTRWSAWRIASVIALVPGAWAAGQAAFPSTRPTGAPSAAASSATQAAAGQAGPVLDAAWSTFRALRDYVHATQTLGQPRQRAEGMEKASRDLLGLVEPEPGADLRTLSPYVALWPVIVAHYVDGFDRGRLRLLRATDGQAVVTLSVANPQDQQVYDRLFGQITRSLEQEGYAGQKLEDLRAVRLRRELAQQGVGYPPTATIVLGLRNVDGKWKAVQLDLEAPPMRAPGSPVTSQPAQRQGGSR